MNYLKYKAFKPVLLPGRKWPERQITTAPIWCSVDLRDGNQSLETPMNLAQKIEFFKFLVNMGFKEIEIGFPAASETEFAFARRLIEDKLIPDDVVIQVLTQSRDTIIRKTFESLVGVRKAVVHLYNSTSKLQRDVVFNKSKEEILELAVTGAKQILQLAEEYGRERFIFEYSPESFTGTELDYAANVVNAVLDVWKPTSSNKAIINLPSTVEMSVPNIYADQIEYVCGKIKNRECAIISVHTHNDRGTAVAASELALMAGAERVEGTLFGNGERTGNADLLTIAMNLYTQGIDPQLDFSNIDEVVDIYERNTGLIVGKRHPYAGTLVYTAFSGSHQDAINKGLKRNKEHPEFWEVPYLPIDPVDVGRTYDPVIRINSQSGKGGVAFILQQNYGLLVPRAMQVDFGRIITNVSDSLNKELISREIFELFEREYVNIEAPLLLKSFKEESDGDESTSVISLSAEIIINSELKCVEAKGNGVVDAFCKALRAQLYISFEIKNYSEHSLNVGSDSSAITYIEITDDHGESSFGAGISSSISKSSLRALVSAVNKKLSK